MLGSAFPPAGGKGDCLWSAVQVCQLLLDWTAGSQRQPEVWLSLPGPEFAVSSLTVLGAPTHLCSLGSSGFSQNEWKRLSQSSCFGS